jgi:hypothetical protein
VSDYPAKPRYGRIEVNPTVYGGDPDRQADYLQTAQAARDHCFIGQTVAAGGLSYEVGAVRVFSGGPDEDLPGTTHLDGVADAGE